MRVPVAIVLGIGLFAAGCGGHRHAALATRVDHDGIHSVAAFERPLEGDLATLTVLPTIVEDRRTEPIEGGDSGHPFSTAVFDHALEAMLLASGGFEIVRCVQGEDELLDDDVPQDGLLLRLQLDSQSMTRVDEKSSGGWTIAMWYLFLGVPAWWVHDQTYRLTFHGQATIWDRATGRELRQVDLGYGSSEESLNFHERTGSLTPYLLVNIIPPPTVAPDPDSLMEALAPGALADPLQRLREAFLAVEATPPPIEKPQRRIAIRMPPTDGVDLEFESPEPGAFYEGGPIDVAFDIVLPEEGQDLAWVTINGEREIRYDDGRPIPIQARWPVRKKGVPFVDGEIRIAVKLFSAAEPIDVTIAATP